MPARGTSREPAARALQAGRHLPDDRERSMTHGSVASSFASRMDMARSNGRADCHRTRPTLTDYNNRRVTLRMLRFGWLYPHLRPSACARSRQRDSPRKLACGMLHSQRHTNTGLHVEQLANTVAGSAAQAREGQCFERGFFRSLSSHVQLGLRARWAKRASSSESWSCVAEGTARMQHRADRRCSSHAG